jgi:hypothetical protein
MMATLPRGIAGLPVGLPGLPSFVPPTWTPLFAAQKTKKETAES